MKGATKYEMMKLLDLGFSCISAFGDSEVWRYKDQDRNVLDVFVLRNAVNGGEVLWSVHLCSRYAPMTDMHEVSKELLNKEPAHSYLSLDDAVQYALYPAMLDIANMCTSMLVSIASRPRMFSREDEQCLES